MIDLMQVTPFTAFQFEECVIRVIKENGNVFFVSKDIASAFGYKNPYTTLQKYCFLEPQYAFIETKTGPQLVTVIIESDVRNFIAKSTKRLAAERFKNWFEEILPIIKNPNWRT